MIRFSSRSTIACVSSPMFLYDALKLLVGDCAGEHLLMAASTGDMKQLSSLLDARVFIDYQDEDGRTALAIACSHLQEDAVQALICQNASLELPDDKGQTPLMLASATGRTSLVRKLLQAGARRDVRDQSNQTASCTAA